MGLLILTAAPTSLTNFVEAELITDFVHMYSMFILLIICTSPSLSIKGLRQQTWMKHVRERHIFTQNESLHLQNRIFSYRLFFFLISKSPASFPFISFVIINFLTKLENKFLSSPLKTKTKGWLGTFYLCTWAFLENIRFLKGIFFLLVSIKIQTLPCLFSLADYLKTFFFLSF